MEKIIQGDLLQMVEGRTENPHTRVRAPQSPLNCKYCGKSYKDKLNLGKHEKHCFENPNRIDISEKMKNTYKKSGGAMQIASEYICPYCNKKWTVVKSGFKLHVKSCKLNPERVDGSTKGLKLTNEQKKKISNGVKKAHDEGRGHTWKNRYLNPIYAEQWLYGFLDAKNIQYEKEVPFKGFFLDVVIGNKVIEIDGEQHYDVDRFPEQQERDTRKDTLLKENGFEELRLRWSLIQSDKENQIKILESFLNK